MLLLRKRHIVAIGIILVVVGVVGQGVRNVIRLRVVSHALVIVSRLSGFVIVRVCVRRGVVLVVCVLLIVRRVWRSVVRGRETWGSGVGMARAVLALSCGGRNERGVARLMGCCRRLGRMRAG